MEFKGISTVGMTQEILKKDLRLWDKIDAGKYQLMYVTEKIILDKIGYFVKKILRMKNEFMKNLMTVAIDECHLVWEWINFRRQYGFLGNLKQDLGKIPFVCLSATLTPNVAAYIHEVCKLSDGTILFWMNTYRANINLIVSKIDHAGNLESLLSLIPDKPEEEIPKTLIFHDGIDNGICIARQLRARLRSIGNVDNPNIIVRVYYGSIDSRRKRKILDQLRSGRTRIVVCTDAFGMGVDIDDIKRIIQWQVDSKFTISKLQQRIGRCVRDQLLEDVAIVYVNKKLFEVCGITRENWQDAWKDPASFFNPDSDELDDFEIDPVRIIPICKDRDIAKFGLSMDISTRANSRKLAKSLYRKTPNLAQAHLDFKREISGTKIKPIPVEKKIDPSLLWFLCIMGYRNDLLGQIFQDPDLFHRSHKY